MNKKPKYYLSAPSHSLDHYDAVEVSGVIEDAAGEVRRVYPGETAHFFSVYLHNIVEGGVECIADLPTEGLAKEFGRIMDLVLFAVANEAEKPEQVPA